MIFEIWTLFTLLLFAQCHGIDPKEDMFYARGFADDNALSSLHSIDFIAPSEITCCVECNLIQSCKAIVFKREIKQCIIFDVLPLQRVKYQSASTRYRIIARLDKDQNKALVAFSKRGMFIVNPDTKSGWKMTVTGYKHKHIVGAVFANGSLYIVDTSIHRGVLKHENNNDTFVIQEHFVLRSKSTRSTLYGLVVDIHAGQMFTLGYNAIYSVSMATKSDMMIRMLPKISTRGNNIVNIPSKRLLYFTQSMSLMTCNYKGENYSVISSLPGCVYGLIADVEADRLLWTTVFPGQIYSMDIKDYAYQVLHTNREAKAPASLVSLLYSRFVVVAFNGKVLLFTKDGKVEQYLGTIPECENCRIWAATQIPYSTD